MKLNGLRSRLAQQAPEIEAHLKAIKATLPEHIAAVRADFANEWSKGVSAFGALLGKRLAVESLIGKLDSLPEPRPATCDLLPDVQAPWEMMKRLAAGLDEIAGWSRAAALPAVDSMMKSSQPPFDRSAVYVITDSAAGMDVGTLVMESSFAPGWLAHLAHIDYAHLLSSVDWQQSLEPGKIRHGHG